MAKEKKKKQENKVIGDAQEINQDILPGYSFSSNWKSPESFGRYIETQKRETAWNDAGWSNEYGEWSGTKNMEEALRMVKNGWKAGGEQVESMRKRIEASHPTAPRLIKYGIAGTTPSVPRAIAGNIMNMRLPDMTKSRKKPVITIVSNMAANCMVEAHQISNRAAAVAAIVDKIEAAGYSVEVIATATSEGSWRGDRGYTVATSIVVKQSDQPVDIIRLAFGLGHAAMFRRLVFADWGVEPTARDGLGYGLGHSCPMDIKKDENMDTRAIYTLPSAETHGKYFDTPEKSITQGLAYLMQNLKEQGCPAFAKVDVPDPESFKEPEKTVATKKKRKRG